MRAIFLDRYGTINAGTKTILAQTGTAKEALGATHVAEDLLAAASYIASKEQLHEKTT